MHKLNQYKKKKISNIITERAKSILRRRKIEESMVWFAGRRKKNSEIIKH
jgi:hypothetical protein